MAATVGIKGAKLADLMADLSFLARRKLATRLRKLDVKAIENLSSGLTGKELLSVLDTWGDDVVNAAARQSNGAATKAMRQYCY